MFVLRITCLVSALVALHICVAFAESEAQYVLCAVCQCVQGEVMCRSLVSLDLLNTYDGEDVDRLRIIESDLSNLKEDHFSKFRNVSSVVLNSNKFFGNISIFSTLAQLKTLNMDNNTIGEIYPIWFDNNTRLLNLSLNDNSIKYLANDTFRNLHNLTTLHLANNIIEEIDSGALIGLSSLEEFDASSNNLKHLKPNTFSPLRNLTVLILRNNPLQNISEGNFKDLPRLQKLDIKSSLYTNGSLSVKVSISDPGDKNNNISMISETKLHTSFISPVVTDTNFSISAGVTKQKPDASDISSVFSDAKHFSSAARSAVSESTPVISENHPSIYDTSNSINDAVTEEMIGLSENSSKVTKFSTRSPTVRDKISGTSVPVVTEELLGLRVSSFNDSDPRLNTSTSISTSAHLPNPPSVTNSEQDNHSIHLASNLTEIIRSQTKDARHASQVISGENQTVTETISHVKTGVVTEEQGETTAIYQFPDNDSDKETIDNVKMSTPNPDEIRETKGAVLPVTNSRTKDDVSYVDVAESRVESRPTLSPAQMVAVAEGVLIVDSIKDIFSGEKSESSDETGTLSPAQVVAVIEGVEIVDAIVQAVKENEPAAGALWREAMEIEATWKDNNKPEFQESSDTVLITLLFFVVIVTTVTGITAAMVLFRQIKNSVLREEREDLKQNEYALVDVVDTQFTGVECPPSPSGTHVKYFTFPRIEETVTE